MKKIVCKFFLLNVFLMITLSGCCNFFNGSSIKNELEEKIAYANAKKVSFEMQLDNAIYGTIYPASATVIKGESFDVTFTQQLDALAVTWKVFDQSNRIVKNAISYSEDIKTQTDGAIIHNLKVTVTDDSVSNLILKPFFLIDMPDAAIPVINSVSLYGDKAGTRKISDLHPDHWSDEGNGINNETETPAIAYSKYKDTPWYKNCVSEVYLSMSFTLAESDIKEIKVTEALVRNKSNDQLLNPDTYTHIIPRKHVKVNGKGNYSLSMYPLDFMSKAEGMIEYKISVINSYGLETSCDTVFYVIKHTKYGGELNLTAGLDAGQEGRTYSEDDIKNWFEYSYRHPDSNGIDSIGAKYQTWNYIPISTIFGSDICYSLGNKRSDKLCYPQTICVEYYDEGDTEKHIYTKYKDPGMFNDGSMSNYYLKLVFNPTDNNNIQNYTLTDGDFKNADYVLTNAISVNQIKRNANKRTFIDITVTSESGFSQTKTLTIEPSINIKYYLENTTSKRIYLYTDLGNEDSDFTKNYGRLYIKQTSGTTTKYSISDSNFIDLTASSEYEVYAMRHTEGFNVYSCYGKPFKFKTDSSKNVIPVNSVSSVSMPSLSSNSFTIGIPAKNKSTVPVTLTLPEDYVIPAGIKLLFHFEYTVTDNLGSNIYSTVCEQNDINLRSNFNHTLKAMYAQDSSGVYISTIKFSGIYVDLTDKKYDNEPPYTTGTGISYLNYNDVSKITMENMKFIKENGSGLEVNKVGKGIIHYWLKLNKNEKIIEPIKETELQNLTENIAYYDLETGTGVIHMNLPEQGVYSFYSRVYDNNGNYTDALDIKYKGSGNNKKVIYYKTGGEASSTATKQYYSSNNWTATENNNFLKKIEWIYENGVFSRVIYSINPEKWSSYNCNLTNISKDLYGYTIQADAPALIQYMYHCTDLGDDKDSWGTLGCEQYVTQVTSSYSVKQSIIDRIPAGNYYTVLVHYMDGTVQMTPVEYKSR